MNLAEPARPASPATATIMAQDSSSMQNDKEYKVEAAENTDELSNHCTKMDNVEPAELIDDARRFAPVKQLNEPHGDRNKGISVEKLKSGGSGFSFEGEAGVCKGMEMHAARKITLVLSKILPAVWDERGM